MTKTTEALKSIRAILAEPDDEETISKIREALAKCKPAPDGRIPKTVFTLDDISKAAEMGRQAGMIDALAEPVKQEPVAVISESAIGLVKLHSNGACLPFGTQLYAAPVSAKREWVDLEPWQLCEIEERIGLPIDSHDFETIGNAYIAAFKERNN